MCLWWVLKLLPHAVPCLVMVSQLCVSDFYVDFTSMSDWHRLNSDVPCTCLCDWKGESLNDVKWSLLWKSQQCKPRTHEFFNVDWRILIQAWLEVLCGAKDIRSPRRVPGMLTRLVSGSLGYNFGTTRQSNKRVHYSSDSCVYRCHDFKLKQRLPDATAT